MAKRNTGSKAEVPGTVIPVDDSGGTAPKADALAWLAAAGVDTAAIKAEWKASPNKSEPARQAVISRIMDRHGLRVRLQAHARGLLEKAIA